MNHFARRHNFFTEQSLGKYTTIQRRAFERDIYDHARANGLSKAQAKASTVYARQLCGEEDYDSDNTKLDDDEIDDPSGLPIALSSSIGQHTTESGVPSEETVEIPNARSEKRIGDPVDDRTEKRRKIDEDPIVSEDITSKARTKANDRNTATMTPVFPEGLKPHSSGAVINENANTQAISRSGTHETMTNGHCAPPKADTTAEMLREKVVSHGDDERLEGERHTEDDTAKVNETTNRPGSDPPFEHYNKISDPWQPAAPASQPQPKTGTQITHPYGSDESDTDSECSDEDDESSANGLSEGGAKAVAKSVVKVKGAGQSEESETDEQSTDSEHSKASEQSVQEDQSNEHKQSNNSTDQDSGDDQESDDDDSSNGEESDSEDDSETSSPSELHPNTKLNARAQGQDESARIRNWIDKSFSALQCRKCQLLLPSKDDLYRHLICVHWIPERKRKRKHDETLEDKKQENASCKADSQKRYRKSEMRHSSGPLTPSGDFQNPMIQ